jgi:hypothetical protein
LHEECRKVGTQHGRSSQSTTLFLANRNKPRFRNIAILIAGFSGTTGSVVMIQDLFLAHWHNPMSRLVRSVELSNSEKLRLVGLMKETVEQVPPLEHELNKLERKAESSSPC